jgi:hypothetical protein
LFPLVLGGNQPPNDVKRREKETAFEYSGKETVFASSLTDGGPLQEKKNQRNKEFSTVKKKKGRYLEIHPENQ